MVIDGLLGTMLTNHWSCCLASECNGDSLSVSVSCTKALFVSVAMYMHIVLQSMLEIVKQI